MRFGSVGPRRVPHFVVVLLAAAMAHACAAVTSSVEPAAAPIPPPAITLPSTDGSVQFAVIGDTGTGGSGQRQLARQLTAAHSVFPFEFVLLMGDNLYGSEGAGDYRRKFEEPYKLLLDAGVMFYASLGNHDDTNQIFYERFNMGGRRFYTFTPQNDVRIFALDSNYMSPDQLQWLEKELSGSDAEWKIAFFHHPLYSTGGRHGSDVTLRRQLEPVFVKYEVDVVFSGHEHFYERLRPQKGIHYFTSGGGGKLRRGDIEGGPIHDAGFDEGYHFMLIEIVDDVMHFQVVSAQGVTVDSGTVMR